MTETPKKENGLTLRPIRTKVRKRECVADIQAAIAEDLTLDSELLFVAYMAEEVIIDRYTPDTVLEKDLVLRLRVFNRDEELFLWRSRGTLKGRVRYDYPANSEKGDPVDIVEANQVLFGTRIDKRAENRTRITEDRGTSLTLPFSDLKSDKNGLLLERPCITTYNYIGCNEAHQATYIDCRFVRLLPSHPDKAAQQGGQI